MNIFIKLFLVISFANSGLLFNQAFAKADDYEAAIQAYNSQDIDAALIHLKNALRENKSNLPAKILLAKVLIKKRSFIAAEEELNDASLQGADFNLIVEPLANSLLLQGKFDPILHLVDQKKLHGKALLSYEIIKAKAYIGLSNIESAEEVYKDILKRQPNNTEVMVELAAIYIVKAQNEKSQSLLSKVEIISSDNARFWQVKGQLAGSYGQAEAALSFYKKASEIEPSNIVILRAMASSNISLGKFDEAHTILDNVLTSNPKDIQAQLMKGNILKSQDKPNLASEILMKLTNQLSTIDESYMLSQPQLLLIDALSSYGQKNWFQAQKKFQIYLNQRIKNDDMSAVVLLADVYVKLKQPESALKLLEGYESKVIKNNDYAIILVDLYLQFNKNFKADYVLKRLQRTYTNDEDVLLLSARVLSNTGQEKAALELLESYKKPSSVRYKHSLTVIALRLGELNKALSYAKSVILLSPNEIDYQLVYIETLLQMKQFNEAKKVIEILYKKHPEDKRVQFSYAMLQFNLDNLAIAKKLFDKLVKESPKDGESWFVLAQIAYDLGEEQEAIAILERQTKNEGYRNNALHKLAAAYYSMNEYEKSLPVVNVLLKNNRLDAKAISIKAKNLIALNEVKAAKHQLDILFGLWSEDARNLVELSKLQLQVNDINGSETSLEIAYNIAPNALPVIIDIIKVKVRLNKLVEASSLLKKADRSGYKNNVYILILKGDVELAKGNTQRAFSYYSSVLKNDETNIIALIKLSQISQSKKLSGKFINQLVSIIKKHPDLALQRHVFADHLFEQKKYERAKFQYQLLITQDIPPEKRALALNNLAHVYLNESAYQAAVETSKQAVEMLPSSSLIDTLGWALVESGDAEQGLSYLRQAFSMSSTQPDIQYHIAYALVKLERKEEAKRLLTDIVKLPNTFKEHKLANELLLSL